MTPRARKRLVGGALVVGSALASAAYGGLGVTTNPAQSRPIPPSMPGTIVFSARNTGTSTLLVGSATNTGGPNVAGCMAMTITPYNVTPPYMLAPGAQAQYIVTTKGFAATSSCTYTIPFVDQATMLGSQTSVQAVFNIAPTGSSAAPVDLQAQAVSFGSQTTFEFQALVLSDYGGATYGQPYTLQIDPPDPTNSVHFASPCSGSQCSVTTASNAGGSATATLECEANGSGLVSANVDVIGSGGALLGSSAVQCLVNGSASNLAISPSMVTMSGPPGALTGSGSATVTSLGNPDTLTMIQISGGPFSFETPTPCTGLGPCSVSLSLPQTLWFACTPVAGMTTTATLSVQGSGSNDTAQTTLDCVPNATGPLMTVTPNSIGPATTPVGTPVTASPAVAIGNSGDQDLTGIVVAFTNGDWSTAQCTAGNPCTVKVGDPPLQIAVTFDPSTWGTDNGTMNVTASSDPNHPGSVSLLGTGNGAVLLTPTPTSWDFGTISRGQVSTHHFAIGEDGNVGTMLTIAATDPLFTTSGSLALSAGGNGMFDVSCGSASAGSGSDTISITADSNVYMGSPQSVGVSCVVADTDVVVMPTLDFGEVRVGTTPPAIAVKIVNQGAAAATLHRVVLSDSHGGQLQLAPVITSDVTLAANGGEQDATLTLGTSAEVDLTGTQLLVDVDTAHLAPAISGKVVTPHSHIAPTTLDLGTACVGAQVSGTEMLINDGTATLKVSPPTMDQGFAAFAQSPASYPTMLAPGGAAVIEIKPAASAVGTVTGTLTWMDDVPSNYLVPVSLEYVPSGTAVSPAQLDFGQVQVEVRSDQQTITLQNCDAAAMTVNVIGVTALRGPASAWDVEPLGMHVLAPGEKLMLTAAFSPLQSGPHHAQVKLDLGGQASAVDLYGDGIGGPQRKDSFYACSCNGPGAPATGWPIVLALVVIVVRRRRS